MIVVLFVFCLGLILGSFFNVLICRIPIGKSVIWQFSHCPKCKNSLKPWHNIPVISYVFLKGKCHFCKKPIAITYPLVELVTAGATLILLHHLIYPKLSIAQANIPDLLLQSIFLLLIIPISIIDLQHFIIPDRISLPLLVLAFALSFIPGSPTPFFSILGILGGGGSLLLIGWIGTKLLKKGDAMGGGDIKLMAAAGALWGAQIALMGIIFGAFLGSIYGIALMISKKMGSNHQIPFGPFLGAGLWISVLYGESILQGYLMLINRLVGAE